MRESILMPEEIKSFCSSIENGLNSITDRREEVSSFVYTIRKALQRPHETDNSLTSGYYHKTSFMNMPIILYWDIPLLLKSDERPTPIKVCVNHLMKNLDPFLFEDPFAKPRTSGPILLAELPFIETGYCIIDGNHRLIQAQNKGDQTISAKWYRPKQHIKYMTPYSALLATVCTNTVYFSEYLVGTISRNNYAYLSVKIPD